MQKKAAGRAEVREQPVLVNRPLTRLGSPDFP
jgi:hypothetical protein